MDNSQTYISIPPKPTAAMLGQAMVDLRTKAATNPLQKVLIAAGSANFIRPTQLCGLRALLDDAAFFAESVSFECPQSNDLHNYLARMNFYDGLPPNVRPDRRVPLLRRNELRGRLIELARLTTAEQVDSLHDRVMAVSRDHFFNDRLARAFSRALAVSAENSIMHAESPDGALVAAQRYPRRQALEIAIVDLGRGVRRSLTENPKYAGLSDRLAVRRAFEPGVSRLDDPGQGGGLPELVEKAGAVSWSRTCLVSGTAEVNVVQLGDSPAFDVGDLPVAVPGTWMEVVLRA